MKTIKISVIAIALSIFAVSSSFAQNTKAKALALESLTTENSVMVYCDYLTGLDDYITTIPANQYRNNVTAFLKLNQIFPMPTAILGDEGDYRGVFYPEVKKYVTNQQKYFGRTTPSAYTPEFAQWLKSTGRKNVIIGGLSIDNCVLHTTLDLIRNGYNVHIVIDVSGTNNLISEEAAIRRMEKAGAISTTWITVATELVKDWNTPVGQKLFMEVVMAHLAGSTVGVAEDPTGDIQIINK